VALAVLSALWHVLANVFIMKTLAVLLHTSVFTASVLYSLLLSVTSLTFIVGVEVTRRRNEVVVTFRVCMKNQLV
jgi:hypothetical protein